MSDEWHRWTMTRKNKPLLGRVLKSSVSLYCLFRIRGCIFFFSKIKWYMRHTFHYFLLFLEVNWQVLWEFLQTFQPEIWNTQWNLSKLLYYNSCSCPTSWFATPMFLKVFSKEHQFCKMFSAIPEMLHGQMFKGNI